MNKVTLSIATTIDGYIARENGSVDFLDEFNKMGTNFGMNDFIKSVDIIAMGRATYNQYSSHPDFFKFYKGKQIYVFTRSKFEDSRIELAQDPKQFVDQVDGHIWLLGGASLIKSFYNLELIDEYTLTIIPVILGNGIPLFDHLYNTRLHLVAVEQFEGGVVNLHYSKSE